MLGRFSNALQQAADVLAPPPPLYEDFVYYWKKVMNHYLDVSKAKPIPIEMTNIPNHLEQLLKILQKEEEDSEGVGACLEYLLQHNLLDLMVTLASSDDPPGMKQHILQFISKFISQTKTLAIGHSNVYLPLQRLVGLCDGVTPTPCERHEIQFLLSLSAVLRRNPQLVPLFITNSGSGAGSCSSGGSDCPRRASFSSSTDSESSLPNNPLFTTPLVSSARASTVTLLPAAPPHPGSSSPDTAATPPDTPAFFPLADAVFSYVDSPDTEVRLKACQAILLVVSLPQGSRVASLYAPEAALKLVSRLVLLYFTIPHSTEPTHVDDTHTSWGLDIPTNMECSGCDGCKQAASFLSWLDFCDQVMIEGAVVVAEAVSRKITDSFLGQAFTVASLQRPITLTLLIKSFKMASSPHLISVLKEWLCGEEVLHSLLQNWTSQDTELALETLRLFELVLEKGDSDILYRLVLRYLNNRTYLDTTQHGDADGDDALKENPGTAKDINTIIKLWTSVVPEEVQSSGGGYDEYLAESLRQYRAVVAKVAATPGSTPTQPALTGGQPGEIEEGPFLKTLFDCLDNIPNQVYEVNLELTGVVSRLALRPEPPVTELLLEAPLEARDATPRCLRALLCRVASRLAPAITQQPGYRHTLSQVRLSLLSGTLTPLPLRRDPWRSAFENMVVVEELCKELAAITHVKLKSSSTATAAS